MFHAGIATHYCESAKLPKIEEELLKDIRFVGDVMKEFCPKPKSEFTLSKHLDQINKCFNAPSIEEILSNLKKDNSEWAKQTIKVSRFEKSELINFPNKFFRCRHFDPLVQLA